MSVTIRRPHASRLVGFGEIGDAPPIIPAWHPAMLAALEGLATEVWALAAILRATPGAWILEEPMTYEDLRRLA